VVEVSEAVENQRFELIRAAKETKTLDKLKEKDYSQFVHEQNVHEQKRVDELSLLKPHKEKSGLYNG
jgi:flagellar export protein FliJ